MEPDLPSDIAARQRFIIETNRSFSVIAPAGVGKTTAIVERITHFALNTPSPATELPKLVVVTYTNKAADEMQQRARNEILRHPQSSVILPHFNRAFFGTIHSFCLRLLNTFGHFLGLPAGLAPTADTDDLWREFVRGCGEIGAPLSSQQRADLFRNLPPHRILDLAREIPACEIETTTLGDLPTEGVDEVLAFEPNKRNAGKVVERQNRLRSWRDAAGSDEGFHPLPELEKGGRDFTELCSDALRPTREWIGRAAHAVAAHIALEFQRFRVERGVVGFDDHVSLAARLTGHPEARMAIRSEGFRILLDEAQDTDPLQFHVLLECARPPAAVGDWMDGGEGPPCEGRFCMVGDPQQSIYGDRADLETYLKVQQKLVACDAAEPLEFETTFRCDREVIGFVNATCESMLDGRDGQVGLVHLLPRPGVLPGQVVRMTVDENPHWATEDGKIPRDRRQAWEARELVRWIGEQGLSRLRASAWSEVAILCPRKRLFQPLARELEKAGIRFQTQSNRDILGDSPAYAWMTALAAIMADPTNGFEIVGVLREVFGLSDDALARWADRGRRPFRTDVPPRGDGPVFTTLGLLADLRHDSRNLPLRELADRLVEATLLRARLAALTGYNALSEQAMVDRLLVQAGDAESRGLTVNRWADELRQAFFNPAEGEVIQPDAIQLITCQKAKGLQWQAVIVPFVFNEIREPNPGYPRVVRPKGSTGPVVLIDKYALSDEEAERQTLRKRQELQRILYVALTRAKHTLVLVDDSPILDGRTTAFGTLLGLGDEERNLHRWTALPSDLSSDAETSAEESTSLSKDQPTGSGPDTELVVVPQTIEFTRRVLPHSLARHGTDAEPEATREEDSETALIARERAIDYGLWWHSVCERAGWTADDEELGRHLERELSQCVDPERGRREWSLLLASDLRARLADRSLVIHSEVPFTWKRDPETIVEGIVDLAAYDRDAGGWIVVDWKTDRVAEDQLTTLMENYRPQIEAYAKALARLTGHPVGAGIYSTAVGRWITGLES